MVIKHTKYLSSPSCRFAPQCSWIPFLFYIWWLFIVILTLIMPMFKFSSNILPHTLTFLHFIHHSWIVWKIQMMFACATNFMKHLYMEIVLISIIDKNSYLWDTFSTCNIIPHWWTIKNIQWRQTFVFGYVTFDIILLLKSSIYIS